ncbi:MAG: hypothetical protein MUP09_05430 [Thiovulaceae bacterium]|nr:hypothetical protein [Sulfurimonadaceae bacterium]
MHEEQLFEMLNEAVEFAKAELETKQNLHPFAMILFENGNIQSHKSDATDQQKQYETLMLMLKERVAEETEITAIALIARVTIPSLYKAPVDDGIRIHLEERHKSGNKIGGRFIYVPYQLFADSDISGISMQLHNPIPVAFVPEIFH